jgi:hypothetical protein
MKQMLLSRVSPHDRISLPHTQPFFEISGGYVDGMGGIISVVFALVKAEEAR